MHYTEIEKNIIEHNSDDEVLELLKVMSPSERDDFYEKFMSDKSLSDDLYSKLSDLYLRVKSKQVSDERITAVRNKLLYKQVDLHHKPNFIDYIMNTGLYNLVLYFVLMIIFLKLSAFLGVIISGHSF